MAYFRDQTASEKQTHFGFREVRESEKSRLVGHVFQSVASRYDVMNDVMSLGIHRAWKHFAASQSGLKPGNAVLDVAAGSGDLSRLFARQVGQSGRLVLTDINLAMLEQGKRKIIDAGIIGHSFFVLADAERLCFPDESFHCVSIAFGLRNVTRKSMALESMCRIVRTGGRLLVLEFSRPVLPLLQKAYDLYSFKLIPKMGKCIANDEQSYQYLVESIRRHPDQQTLKGMMLDAGFDEVRVHNLSGGIVALHIGFKF